MSLAIYSLVAELVAGADFIVRVVMAVALFVARLVVDESFLEQVIGVVEASVVVTFVVLVELYAPDHLDPGSLISWIKDIHF